jgi:hypothetical protein
MFPAHMPDRDKPPLFIDLLARQEADHEAEEYNGAFGADWGVDGRFYTDALPFFQKSGFLLRKLSIARDRSLKRILA